MGTPAVALVDVTKVYGHGRRHRVVLDGVSLAVEEGTITVLLGPSGVGKSTVLRLMAGVETPTRGTVRYGPGIVPLRDVRLVFQEPNLLPWLTVAENVALGLRFGINRGRVKPAVVSDLLARTGLEEVVDAFPATLSGGQAQRANLVRALATAPRLVLLDEPFAALDPPTRRAAQRWLRELVRDLGLTAVLVTHDLDEALTVGERIVLLGGRPARVVGEWSVQDGEAEQLRHLLFESYSVGSHSERASLLVSSERSV